MAKKGLTVTLVALLMAFYASIVLYAFFAVLHIEALANYGTSLTFEIIGFVLLVYFILGNIASRRITVGYFVPLIIVTVLYTIILNFINLSLVFSVSNVVFVLINLIVLFIYCLISVPMYFMGRK